MLLDEDGLKDAQNYQKKEKKRNRKKWCLMKGANISKRAFERVEALVGLSRLSLACNWCFFFDGVDLM